MRLWTIQPIAVFDELVAKGTLVGDPSRGVYWGNEWEMEKPYAWMCEQMAKRIPGYKGGYPWWAWRRWGPGKRRRPDLRAERHKELGHAARLELEVPDELVLVSNFDAWHCVMNDSYVPLGKRDGDRWYKKVEAATGSELTRVLPPDLEAEKRASWERIFDIRSQKFLYHWSTHEGGQPLQACFETLSIEYVRKVDEFHGKSET